MSHYDYKVVPAPKRAKKVKGVRAAEDLFALTLTEAINEVARQGWEYLRAEHMPAEASRGWFRSALAGEQTVLVFRRPRESLSPRLASVRPDRDAVPEAVVPAAPPPTPRPSRPASARSSTACAAVSPRCASTRCRARSRRRPRCVLHPGSAPPISPEPGHRRRRPAARERPGPAIHGGTAGPGQRRQAPKLSLDG